MRNATRMYGRAVLTVFLPFVMVFGSWHVFALASAPSPQATFDATPYLDPSKPDLGLQQLIDSASAAGGGIVQLPSGTFTLEAYLQLRNGVTLKGQGLTTVLAAGRNERRVTVTASYEPYATKTIQVDDVSPLKVGMVVYVWRSNELLYKPSAYTIVGIDRQAQTITLDDDVSYPLTANVSQVSFGLYTKLTQQLRKGSSSYTLHVADPSVFNVGEGLVIVIGDNPPSGHHGWGVEENIVTAINTNQKTLTLKDPIELNAKSGTVVAHGYGAIMTEGFRSKGLVVEHVGIEDLAIQGWATPQKPAFYAFSLGAINLMDCKNVSISRVQVSDWHSDGVSIQACSNAQVTDVTSINNRGRGFHPGTTSDHFEFLRIRGNGNLGYAARSVPGDGFYYCWGNTYVNIRDSEFRNNVSSGIGDLGGGETRNSFVDTNNLIENNIIEGNGRDGIEISGGGVNGNTTIRGNTIRDNGRLEADAAGIAIRATKGYAHKYLITANLVESTTDPATQLQGIKEVSSSSYNADNNIITNNTVRNHSGGNILVRGSNTIVSGNDTTPMVSSPTPTPSVAPVPSAPDITPTPESQMPTPEPTPPAVDNSIALTGSYTDQPEAPRAGQIDYQGLLVTAGVQAGRAGTFSVASDLVNDQDTIIAHAETSVALSTGTQTITLRFAGIDIYRSGENGPYRLKNVQVSDGNGELLLNEFDGNYLTAAYDYTTFAAVTRHSSYLPMVRK